MSEENSTEMILMSVDIEVLIKQGLEINPNDNLKIVVYSTDEEDAS